METKSVSPGKFSVNYGLILGAIMVVLGVFMYISGLALEGKNWPQILYYLIFPVVIIYAISQFKKRNANILSLGQAIKIGVVIAIISALVYGIYSIIFNYLIDPEFMDKLLEVTREKMMENPNMTEEQLEQSMVWVKKMFNPFIGIAFWIFASVIFGLIYSLIGGLIMKNEE